jgi:hypothetical protein
MKWWLYTLTFLLFALAYGCGNSSKPAVNDRQIDARKAEQNQSSEAQRRLRQIDADKRDSNARQWETSHEHAPEF